MSTMGLAVEARDLTHEYRGAGAARGRTAGRAALDGVCLSVPDGQFVALLGPNGSGKSTLLNILATVIAPTRGSLDWWPGEAASAHGVHGRSIRSRLGVVFQSAGLDGLLTVRENLRTAAALYGLGRQQSHARIEELAWAMDISDRLDQRCHTLSGGLRRRADLARAMLHRPDLLLLDEPGTGLDLRARQSFLSLIASLRQERAASAGESGLSGGATGLSVVMSTHLMDEAGEADRVVMMHAGRIVADDSPGALRASMGPAVLRVWVEDERAGAALKAVCGGGNAIVGLAAEGLDFTQLRGWQRVVMPESAEAKQGLLTRLLDSRMTFEHARPTLGDAYLAVTGASLVPETDAEGLAELAANVGRGRRRDRSRGRSGSGSARPRGGS